MINNNVEIKKLTINYLETSRMLDKWLDSKTLSIAGSDFDREKFSPELVEESLSKGANPNALSFRGYTLLTWMISRGALKQAELFLSYGADPNFQNADGSTAMIFAAQHGEVEGAELLNKYDGFLHSVDCKGKTTLMEASTWGHIDMVNYLLQNKANVWAKDNRNKEAIDYVKPNVLDFMAGDLNKYKIVKQLLLQAKHNQK